MLKGDRRPCQMPENTSKSHRFLRLNAADNVVVAITTAEKGGLTSEGIVAAERIGKGHKMAAVAIKSGEPVRKFGQIIGFAKKKITTFTFKLT